MKHDVFSPHQVIQKAFSLCQPENLLSNKHQKQQLQTPSFNTWTILFTLSVNRLTKIVFKKLYKLLKKITDTTRSVENKFLRAEADTLTYYKNQFSFHFSGFFPCFIYS